MKFSAFGDKYNGPSGIGSLMDDLGQAMSGSEPVLMLGGGNPGSGGDPPEICEICEHVDAEAFEVLFQGNAYADSLREGDGTVIDNDQDWQAFLAELVPNEVGAAPSRTNIDFSIEQVVVASYYMSSTCGLEIIDVESCPSTENVHLCMVVDDSSYQCDGACDAGDDDDDNDGVPDVDDPDRLDPFICGDADDDTCDDCSTGGDGERG